MDGGSGESATAIDGDGAERNTNPSEGTSTRPDERHNAKQEKFTSVAKVRMADVEGQTQL